MTEKTSPVQGEVFSTYCKQPYRQQIQSYSPSNARNFRVVIDITGIFMVFCDIYAIIYDK